jgi:hypothetical protein
VKEPQGIVRKQSLINQTKKTVFIWVIGASSVVGAAVVVMILLVQGLIYNERVLAEKSASNKAIEKSITQAKELRGSIGTLNQNAELRMVRSSEKAQALQSVLDALPADANRLAMGASLQEKLLKDVDGVTIESVNLTDEGVSSNSEGEESTEPEAYEQTFTITLSGSAEDLRVALERLERSIRAVNVTTLTGTTANERLTLQVSGSMSYLPPLTIEQTQKKVKG